MKPIHTTLCLLSLALLTCPAALAAPGSFAIHEKPGQAIEVTWRGKPLVHLVTRSDRSTPQTAHDTYKVFLHVHDPQGSGTLTKGPGDKFTHHRGIFIGWSKATIAGRRYDTWHMKGAVRQEFRKLKDATATAEAASFTALIDWVDGDEVLLREERAFTVHKPDPNGAFLLDQASTLTAVKGDAELNGDPEHAGCQFRAAAEVVKNKSARYLFPKGRMSQKEVIAARDLPWAAMSFKANGRQYHVQHMSHPSLPRPIRYSAYRDYGRFGAFFVDTIKQGRSATYKVRFYLSPGPFPDTMVADSQRRYADYAGR